MELNRLIDIVSEETGVDIRDRRRKTDYVMARAVYFRLAYRDLGLGSLEDIGKSIGKDHATVLYSLRTTFTQLERYFPHIYRKYLELKGRLTDGSYIDQDTSTMDLLKLHDKVRELSIEIDRMISGDLKDLIDISRSVPQEKMGLFKDRVEAIAKMI